MLASTFGTLSAQETNPADTVAWSIDIDKVVVTAQYTATSLDESVHEIKTINHAEWRARGLNTLTEVLQQQLNIRINQDPILGSGLNMQGLDGQNVQILIDGVPVIGRVGGAIDLGQINLSQFERVEIAMGSMAAQYGSNAAGGVVNLISKKEQPGRVKIEAGGQYDNFGIDNQYARLGLRMGNFQIDGGVNRYRAELGGIDSLRRTREVTRPDGETRTERITPWNPKDQFGYDANLTFAPTDSLRIRYGFRAFNETLTLPGEIRLPQFPTFAYAFDETFTTERRDHNLSVNYRLGRNLNWETIVGINQFERRKDTYRYAVESDTSSQVEGGQDTTHYYSQLVRSNLTLTTDGPWSGRLGVEYFNESGRGRRILDTATNNLQPHILNAALWGSLRFAPSQRLTVEGNVRLAYNNRYVHPVIPSLQLLWRPDEFWQMRFGYARGFRAPALQELFFNFIDVNHYIIGNQELRPERSHGLRLSARRVKRFDGGGQLTAGAVLFYNQLRDRITLAEFEAGRFTYDNLERYETHGLNLEFAYSAGRRLNLEANHGFTRLLNPRAEIAGAPRFINLYEMTHSLGLDLPEVRSQLRLIHRFVGRQDIYRLNADDELEQGFISDYHLLDLSLSHRLFGDRLTIGGGVRNLLDQQQVAVTNGGAGGVHSGGSGGRLVAFGRSFFLRADFRWE